MQVHDMHIPSHTENTEHRFVEIMEEAEKQEPGQRHDGKHWEYSIELARI